MVIMNQKEELKEALALLDELSTKSSESGLSEETCQELFGGPCPEALRKKIRITDTEILYKIDPLEEQLENKAISESPIDVASINFKEGHLETQGSHSTDRKHTDSKESADVKTTKEEINGELISSSNPETLQDHNTLNHNVQLGDISQQTTKSENQSDYQKRDSVYTNLIGSNENNVESLTVIKEEVRGKKSDETFENSKIINIEQEINNLPMDNSQNINLEPLKRSIGSGDYVLSVDKTQQTYTISATHSDESNKSVSSSHLSPKTQSDQISSDRSGRSFDDMEDTNSDYCACQPTSHFKKDETKKTGRRNHMVNIKYVSGNDVTYPGPKTKEKSIAFRYYPSKQQQFTNCDNKIVQTSKIFLDKRIIYTEIEYPDIPKGINERKDYINHYHNNCVDRQHINYADQKIQIRYPRSFKNSVSPVISSSGISDEELSVSKTGCFEQLSRNLTKRGKVKEVVKKLENEQKLNGRCYNQIQDCSLRLPGFRDRVNNKSLCYGDQNKYRSDKCYFCQKFNCNC